MAGRHSKYDTHIKPHLELIAGWCRDGATEKLIAEKLGVALSSFSEYKKLFPELSDALRVNKEIADINVVGSLYKRAMGYEYEEIKTVFADDQGDTSDGKRRQTKKGIKKNVIKTVKHIPGDVTAALEWLRIRQPEKWRNKQNIDITSGGETIRPQIIIGGKSGGNK